MAKKLRHKKEHHGPSVPWRIMMLSRPRVYTPKHIPSDTIFTGVRRGALKAIVSKRVIEAAFPYARYLQATQRDYRRVFSSERIKRISELITRAGHTIYAKMTSKNQAESVANKGKSEEKVDKLKKMKDAFSLEEMERMERIQKLATPKKYYAEPELADTRQVVPLSELMPRILEMSQAPRLKRHSQQVPPKDPTKVNPRALKYVITERIDILSKPKKYPSENLIKPKAAPEHFRLQNDDEETENDLPRVSPEKIDPPVPSKPPVRK